MGNALVMLAVSEESIGYSELHTCDERGNAIPIEKRDGMWVPGEQRRRTIEQHPNAFFVMRVPYSAVWRPPTEPSEQFGMGWYKKKDVLFRHDNLVKHSLEDFINSSLSELDQMVRTGWFIIKRARAIISEFQHVPGNK